MIPFDVALPSALERRAAVEVHLRFDESSEGEWRRVTGDRAAAEAAGLRTRDARPIDASDAWIPTNADVDARLDGLPGQRVTLGYSREGAPIHAIRFGDGGPVYRVLGGHHGDEGASVEVALALADAIGAGEGPADAEIWIVPLVNPDGAARATRENAAGVDLNRNYAYAWSAAEWAAGDAPFSEPETRAVRGLVRARDVVGALSLHSGAANFGWVWNYTGELRPPEEALFEAVGARYRDTCGAPDFWLTNGADWYITHGDTTDWTYGGFGQHDFTVELSAVKSPPEAEIATYVGWHLQSLLEWLGRPPDRSVRVVDPDGAPLVARVGGPASGPGWSGLDGAWARWGGDAGWAWAPGYAPAPLVAPTTVLEPSDLFDGVPRPRLIGRGDGPTAVRLPGASGVLTLSMPGESAVSFPMRDGAWLVDPAALAPGAWTMTVAEGVVPRGLFIGEVDDRVALTAAWRDGDSLVIEGRNLDPAGEAWALRGAGRSLERLGVRAGSARGLLLDLPPRDASEVLVWSAGAWLAVVDVWGTPTVDTSAPSTDPFVSVPGACRGDSGALGALFLLGFARRRPRPREAR